MTQERQLDPIALLMAYQDACQRFDVEAAVAFFTEEGTLEIAGVPHTGRSVLLDAHYWDRAARNVVTLLDPVVAGDQLTFTFQNQHELHRILGVAPIRSLAEIVLRAGRIQVFRILAPEPESLKLFREKAGPFFDWVRQYHREAWQQTAVLNEAGGRALSELAEAWRKRAIGSFGAYTSTVAENENGAC
jgi:hypothetical protein